ncbi:MAG: hypothetical protein NTZ74_01370 [Chloroflexi bacterium]|nr:hypothetical protein [Chloroflexota bacterium]
MSSHIPEIEQILAADFRFSEINPDDDQIWLLSSAQGEPPALALQTTYGLRAVGMRVFPRFTINQDSISDPHAFSIRPGVDFSAPNFASLHYRPIASLEVHQKIWIPNSQNVVGQITLTNSESALLTVAMEWVVVLQPLHSGSPMSAAQISVNTVLAGQSQHLFPVFYLTGGPRADRSAFPSLHLDMVFSSHATRQFTWALSSLASTEASFFNARKLSAYSLENEQIKLQMNRKGQTIDFHFEEEKWDQVLSQSQDRCFQLLMPPFREFKHPSYVIDRSPDLGYSPAEKGFGRGIQTTTELWEITQCLLPARADLVQDMLQNFIDHQEDNGRIDAQLSWEGKSTGLPGFPLLGAIVEQIYPYFEDRAWLSRIYPSLVRSVQIWFTPEFDQDQDGFPEWRHFVQTGLSEIPHPDLELRNKLEVLVHSSEWPSLVALLWKECESLTRIGNWLMDDTFSADLEIRMDSLKKCFQECQDPALGRISLRDRTTHLLSRGKVVGSFRQNGRFERTVILKNPGRIYCQIEYKDGVIHPLECQIKGMRDHHNLSVTFSGKQFHQQEGTGTLVSEQLFSGIHEITISGMEKGDRAVIGLPDHSIKDPLMLATLWSGILSQTEAEQLIAHYDQDPAIVHSDLPLFLKIMWIEGARRYGYGEKAASCYREWFLNPQSTPTPQSGKHQISDKPMTFSSLYDLIPLSPLLKLLGIEKWSDSEILLTNSKVFFPQVNVQLRKIKIALEPKGTRVSSITGEDLLIEKPGPHRIAVS